MLFSKRKNIDPTTPKRRSMLITLLNPGFGNSLKPIGDSTRVFVNLIAMLFAMNGLFPKNHPAFASGGNNPQVHLTLREVIATAWDNLSFTEKGLPQVLFFFAVIASMAVVVLAVIAGLLSLFIGTAHAQSSPSPSSSAFFTPPTNDLAQNWIDYLFKGQPLSAVLNQGPGGTAGTSVPTITSTGTINIQCAMMTALGFYSNAVLMVAALILFYHLANMVVETAHHGQVMGKRANQIWAPIRLVVAVGLLVPLGGSGPPACGTSGAGLNSAQYITIKIAELGSALASNTWQTFINTIVNSKFNFIQPPEPEVDKVVEDIFMMEACTAAYDYFLTAGGTSPLFNQSSPEFIPPPTVPINQSSPVVGQRWDYQPAGGNIPQLQDVCGHILVPTEAQPSVNDPANDQLDNSPLPPDALAAALMQAHLDTLNIMIPTMRADASRAVAYQVPDWDAQQYSDQPPPNNQVYHNDVMLYVSTLRTLLASKFNNVNTQLKNDALISYGWIAAGTWMNTIARDQGTIVNAINDGMPKTFPPNFDDGSAVPTDARDAVIKFRIWMTKAYTPGQITTAPAPCDPSGLSGQAGLPDPDKDLSEPVRWILSEVDKAAVHNKLWNDEDYQCPNLVTTANPTGQSTYILGTQFSSGNPLGELVYYGQNSMNIAMKMVDNMFRAIEIGMGAAAFNGLMKGLSSDGKQGGSAVAGFAKGVGSFLSQGVSAVTGVLVTIYSMLAVLFLTIGVTLAYILPLIPFMHFFFAAVAWGLVILEGVIAMPLVALAHLNPEGDGLPSGMAKQAYFMLLGLFMRPVLIVFGFIVSLLIFLMAMFLLNKLFAVTVIGTGGLASGYATVSRIIYTVIYVFLAYTCAANCFKIVDNMPEAVFRWISINLGHQKIADGGSIVQSAGGIVTAFASQQALGAIQNVGQQATTATSNMVESATGGARNLKGIGKGNTPMSQGSPQTGGNP